MSALAINPVYAALLMKIPPRVIRTEEQNDFFLAALDDLDHRHDSLTEEESEMADLLTLLIEDFEERQYSLLKSSPAQLVQFLMGQHGTTEEELGRVLGNPKAAHDLTHGSHDLTTDQIRRLSEWSGVSPELFF